eukprot:CAMPEP_0116135172 /NCGR_PEP_ID=MMETSP0329-20121206/11050_1 /TAXON_ID=697910 /ORGANISM="Pseudo-nitzschia arenysensis, Strain B593" /LENGTH=505 /DNA_ID=CAMNT_0003629957 /DNA_START=12 /DNA_END=1531 /DNA_ORIENTATION=-
MTSRSNMLAEEFAIAEEVEEESGHFQDSFLRMRSPLLADHDGASQTRSCVIVLLLQKKSSPMRIGPNNNTNITRTSNASWTEAENRVNREDGGESNEGSHSPRMSDGGDRDGTAAGRGCVVAVGNPITGLEGLVLLARLQENSCSFRATLCVVCHYYHVLWVHLYLSLSIFGSKAEVNPDGSTKTIAFCDMDINDHMEAMYFSLSTMTTIGYGVSDYYFGGCYTPLLMVLLQICTAVVFDAVAVGLIFHRISRGASRSRSIMFSDKAVVRNIKGVPHLMFRLGERRKYHLIEASVRCYCVKHERIPNYHPHTAKDIEAHLDNNSSAKADFSVHVETTPFVSRQMRLVQPDDRFVDGTPKMVVHRIDEKSPLMPSAPLWFDAGGNPHRYPPSSGQLDLLQSATENSKLASLQNFLLDRDVELVVLVEGTDEGTGAATQGRHSYKLCDIAWNHRFADCVHPYSRRQRSGPSSLDPVLSIDFGKFHDILSAPEDCEACAYVPESSWMD